MKFGQLSANQQEALRIFANKTLLDSVKVLLSKHFQ